MNGHIGKQCYQPRWAYYTHVYQSDLIGFNSKYHFFVYGLSDKMFIKKFLVTTYTYN